MTYAPWAYVMPHVLWHVLCPLACPVSYGMSGVLQAYALALSYGAASCPPDPRSSEISYNLGQARRSRYRMGNLPAQGQSIVVSNPEELREIV